MVIEIEIKVKLSCYIVRLCRTPVCISMPDNGGL